MPGLIAFKEEAFFSDIWEICIQNQYQIAHTVYLEKKSIFFFNDIDFICIIGQIQQSILSEECSVHWV